MARQAARVDANHSLVVGALRACGCEVLSLAAIGRGCPDILAKLPNSSRLLIIEVKDGTKSPSKRKLTPAQVEFHKRWPVLVVESVEQAVAALVEPR
jgi:hypothetical protein